MGDPRRPRLALGSRATPSRNGYPRGMAERSERLLLLDTASLYFRAFFGVPDSVKAPDGTPVNAVRGLLDMIPRIV